ncbi:MAG: amidohydrolase [Gammaproteobacteria bacterium]|nr:amidohydrolase [Gammaproteobacteria bacterium]
MCRVRTNQRDPTIEKILLRLAGYIRLALFLSFVTVTITVSAKENRDNHAAGAPTNVPLFNDVHFHLTNYVQQGITAQRYFEIVGDRVGRVAMFGIPLQQKWDHFVSGDRAPDYYLLSDAALYYYSFIDAVIATEYASLSDAQKARVDPMITGFNPTDMYAADHIRRVLLTFPGVFSGIGEFSVHKEFVSSKVTGHTASLLNPALDRIFETVAEIGLVAILHCDIDRVRTGEYPVHYDDLLRLLQKHPGASVIWAHTGLGRFVAPSEHHLALLDQMLGDPRYDHVMFDISWDEVARYVVQDEATTITWASLIEKYPTRFLFGTDSVAPADWDAYATTHVVYEPLWQQLSNHTRAHVERLNYERIFDTAVPRIREWERRELDKIAKPR